MASHGSFRAKWARSLVREKLSAEINELVRRHQDSGAPEGKISRLIPRVLSDIASCFTLMIVHCRHFWHCIYWADVAIVDGHKLPFFSVRPAPVTPHDLPADPILASHQQDEKPQRLLPDNSKVCIVGAGVAGLYIAMILDSLEISGLSYEILEASPRIGGRIYTHCFSQEPHDYYDIGAMRFPQIPIMDRTFKLFDSLGVPQIPYYYDYGSVQTPSRYNDLISIKGETPPEDNDIYKVSTKNGGSVPDATIQKGVDAILEEAFGPFKKALKEDWETGFQKLQQQDKYSTRQYLREKMGYDYFSIQWMETMNTSSGLFDQAFSESVIDSFDFDAPTSSGHVDWTCIEGGTVLVAEAMRNKIKGPVEFDKRVHKISIDKTSAEVANMQVQCSDEPTPRSSYVTVFNTTSLACLQRMDLTGLDLHSSQKDAIRALHYDDSAKVAIKFTYPWWITDCGIKSGGLASTDISLRTCVYPSYNLQDTKEAVLLCSYTWSQDALRVGSLISSSSPQNEEELRELMFDDLAKLHLRSFPTPTTFEEIRAKISGAYVTHHAFSWSHDPFTSGAFALVRILIPFSSSFRLS